MANQPFIPDFSKAFFKPFGQSIGQKGAGAESGNAILGEDYDVWMERLGIGKDEVNDMFGTLGRQLGTQQSQAMNLISDQNYDLPEATKLAQQRGVAQGGQESMRTGTQNIEGMASAANRDAWAKVMAGDMSEEQFKEEMKYRREAMQAQIDSQDSAWWEQLLGGLGSVASSYIMPGSSVTNNY